VPTLKYLDPRPSCRELAGVSGARVPSPGTFWKQQTERHSDSRVLMKVEVCGREENQDGGFDRMRGVLVELVLDGRSD
jgi:hypothetical protein